MNYKFSIKSLLGVFLSFFLCFTVAEAKPKKSKKITFEQCCEKNQNNSSKCHKMKNVKLKKQKTGKKWVKKSCPQKNEDSLGEESYDSEE